MKFTKSTFIFFLLLCLPLSCVTPFEPVGYEGSDNILVIEGDINSKGVTEVYLSRTQRLKDLNKTTYIKGAAVWIESEKGVKFFAQQSINGSVIVYRTQNLVLDKSQKYKLCVSLQGGNLYESELLSVLTSPPIKDIGFKRDTVKQSVT